MHWSEFVYNFYDTKLWSSFLYHEERYFVLIWYYFIIWYCTTQSVLQTDFSLAECSASIASENWYSAENIADMLWSLSYFYDVVTFLERESNMLAAMNSCFGKVNSSQDSERRSQYHISSYSSAFVLAQLVTDVSAEDHDTELWWSLQQLNSLTGRNNS